MWREDRESGGERGERGDNKSSFSFSFSFSVSLGLRVVSLDIVEFPLDL
jgi:hypothetical protein